MRTTPVLRTSLAAVLGLLPFSVTAADVDIPPTVVLSGGTNSDNYTLTSNGQVQGSGNFQGTFNAAAHNLTVDSLTGTLTFDGAISGTASSPLPNLTILAGSNAVVLNGNNTFTGDLILDSGTLRLGHANALGDNAGQFRTSLGAVTLDLNGQAISGKTASLGANLVIENTSGAAASWGGAISNSGVLLNFSVGTGAIEVGGVISHAGAGGVEKTGVGTLTVSGDNTSLNAAWNLGAGTLRFGNSNAVGAVGVLVSAAGTTLDLAGQVMVAKPVDINATSATILNSAPGAARWNGAIQTALADTTIALDAAAGDLFIAGPITQGAARTSLSVTGTNLTTLASSGNTYTGNTVLAGGNLTLASGSFLEFIIGGNGTNNAITGTGSVLLGGNFGFTLGGASTTFGDSWKIVDTGALAVTWNTNFEVLGFSDLGLGLWERNQSGTLYQFNQATGQLSVVPEPSTVMLLVVGGAGILFAGWRRRRAS